MNTLDIVKSLADNPCTRDLWGGVYAVDELPLERPVQKSIYVINTDVSTGPGLHWVVVFLPRQDLHGEFFDSLGQDLTAYHNNIKDFMFTNVSHYLFNAKRLQQDSSSVCGLYCIYYIMHRCSGLSLPDIVNHFGSNVACNDFKVFNWWNKHMY